MTYELIIEEAKRDSDTEAEHVEPQWERAECTCPDWCERDHEQD